MYSVTLTTSVQIGVWDQVCKVIHDSQKKKGECKNLEKQNI